MPRREPPWRRTTRSGKAARGDGLRIAESRQSSPMNPINNPMKYTNAHESEIATPQAPVRSGGVGSVPRRFVEQVEAATSANIVEFASLPKVRERCPISGASRSWLIETNAWLPRHQQFLVRVRRSGCLRGKVFVSVPKLSAFIRDVQAGEVEGFTKE